MKGRVAAVVCTAAMVMSLGVAPAWADGSTTTAGTWDQLTAAFAAGGTVQLTADIDNPHDANLIAGSTPVTLDLDGHDLQIDVGDTNVLAGVEVGHSADLTVEDTAGGGSLTAQGGVGGAGIGGDGPSTAAQPEQAGAVTITGGTVTADGGAYAAGIGSGDEDDDGCARGNRHTVAIRSVTITGGSVTANGGDQLGTNGGGAGIGGSHCGGAGGTVMVSDGSLTATGGRETAGIGGGSQARGGPVTVSGGTVTANGGAFGAAIGGGDTADGGTVTVSAGTVTANGGSYGSGIGGGDIGNGGRLTVNGGSVTATGGYTGAGVGGGQEGSGGPVAIRAGGSLTAYCGPFSPSAIGYGEDGNAWGSLTNAGLLTIPSGCALSIPQGVEVPSSGTIHVAGVIGGQGTIHNLGVINGAGNVAGGGVGPVPSTLLIDHHNVNLVFQPADSDDHPPAPLRVYARTAAAAGLSLPGGPSPTFDGWYTAPTGGTQVTNSTDLIKLAGQDGPVTVTLYEHAAPVAAGGLSVTHVSPTSGKALGGSTVTITGHGFTGTPAVLFGTGETPASAVHVDSATSITATAPEHLGGLVDVRVVDHHQASPAANGDRYRYLAATVGKITPYRATANGGTTVTLNGTGFTGTTKVSFGGVDAQQFTVLSDTQLTAVTPPNGPGPADVLVTGPDGTGGKLGGFTYLAVPEVDAVSTRSVSIAGGEQITLLGSSFTGARVVSFGYQTKTTDFTVVSDTRITVTVPAHDPGTVDVRVGGPGGPSVPTTYDRVTYS